MRQAARVLVASALVVAATVGAGSASGATAGLKLEPSKGPPTTSVQFTGGGFAAGETVDVTFDGTDVASTTADGTGSIAGSFSVPAGAAPGKHSVKATGASSHVVERHAFTVQTDWPALRYSATKTGANPFENVIDTANVGTLTNDWTSPTMVGSARNSPVEVGGIVYISDTAEDVWAFDGVTGATKWHVTVPTESCCGSDLTFDKGMLFESYAHEIWALSATNGGGLWHTCDYVHGTCMADSDLTPPTVAGGRVFAGDEYGNLYAVNESTGGLVWKDALSGGLFDPIEAAPAVDTSTKTLYVQDDSNRFYAINTSNGHVRWQGNRPTDPIPVGGFTENWRIPTVADGAVFVASSVDGNLTAFPAGGCGAKKCDPLWTTTMHGTGGSSPAVAGGIVYVAAETPDQSSHSIMAVDEASGTELWNTGVLAAGAFGTQEGPSVANGVVYAGNADGDAYGFDAATGAQLWAAPVGGVATTPVVVNGHVYVGNDTAGQLLSFALP